MRVEEHDFRGAGLHGWLKDLMTRLRGYPVGPEEVKSVNQES